MNMDKDTLVSDAYNLIPAQWKKLSPTDALDALDRAGTGLQFALTADNFSSQLTEYKAQRESWKKELLQKLLNEQNQKISQLSNEQKQAYEKALQAVHDQVTDVIKNGGAENISGLSKSEYFLLASLHSRYVEQRSQVGGDDFTMDLSSTADNAYSPNDRLTLSTLVRKLALQKIDISNESHIESSKETLGFSAALTELQQMNKGPIQRYQQEGRTNLAADRIQKLRNAEETQDVAFVAAELTREKYLHYRFADYPVDGGYEEVLAYAQLSNDPQIGVKIDDDWVFRGKFRNAQVGERNETRASLNVRVDASLIDALDELIKNGLQANYKIGLPDTGAAADKRHDSVTIYFLEQPTSEQLLQIEAATKGKVRGDSLLGRKLADGFYISEIGSIQKEHIAKFIADLTQMDPQLAKGIAEVSSRTVTLASGRAGRDWAVSEARYYAIKDVLELFGYSIGYDSAQGFSLKKK